MEMIGLLEKLMGKYIVAITSGWMFGNINNQILSHLSIRANLKNLYLFPTNAAKMYCFEFWTWVQKYSLDLKHDEIKLITSVLNKAITSLNLKPEIVWWDIVENRDWCQITYSALGQKAPLNDKQKWDPTKEKRLEIVRHIENDLKNFWVYACWTTSIDVVRKWIDKSYWVEKMIELFGVERNEILYIWDALYEWWNDYVVIKTWIDTKKVDSLEDTKNIMRELLK
jgi:hypothetical protein